MNLTTAKVKLDTWHKNCVVVSTSQGEVNARFLEITLVDGGEPLNLEGTTVLIYAEKPDKNVIFNNCKIENAEKGIVSVGLTSQMSVLSGKLDCEIHIINREKSTLKILGLQIRVMPCANSDSAVESISEFTVLSDAIEQTLEIMDQYSEENIMGKIRSMDGEGSGLDADLLDGKHGSEYATKAQGTKADSAIQGVQGNGTTITPNANKVVNVTPSNIGAVPNTRKINNKALSADITLIPSDIGAAASSHGNHVPTTQTADNKVFLRNDNSWQTVTPANIGAVPTTRKVNNKALSADITLSYSDVGAANEQHNHSAYEISSGTLPIERGGTNASTSTQALENLGGVPKTRTVNNKALSSDISLTASDVGASASGHSHAFSTLTSKPTTLSGYGITDAVPATRKVNNKALSSDISLTAGDVGAATTAQGTKADSALQGVKVNGTLVTPDSNKTVNIDATSISAATPEQGAKADSAIQGIQGNGTTIAPNANKIVNITPSNIGAVPTSRTVNGKALSNNISLTASDVGAAASSHGNHVPTVQTASNKIFLRNDNTWQTVTPSNIGAAASSHNHSASNITSGTLPISRGGTGATSASTALSNLGMIISSGTWTPTLSARDGTAPTYTLGYRYARYYRINNLVYITFHLKAKITNAGSGYAAIKGLPFTAVDGADGQSFTVRESLGAISSYPASAHLSDSTATINIQSSGGDMALQWKTGDLWIGFSGCYIKS